MLLSLNPIVPTYPQFAYDSTGQVSYTPASEVFSLTATPLTFSTSATSSPLRVTGTRTLAIQMHVDNAGNLVVMPGDGLTVNGAVTVNGHAYSGTLLTGSIANFGFTNDTSGDVPPNTDTDTYYFSFQPTGGSMAALFGNGDIGFLASSEHSTFAGSFQTSFTGGAKGTIGPIGAPSITTVAGGTVVVGSGTPLTDSATLSGGQSPTGTITFQLTGPGNTVVDTETVAVSGNGTCNTPTGYLPTAVGTYQWQASYSGDTGNVTVRSAYGAEPEIVSPASAAFSTTPGMTSMTLGASSVPLTDWAVLAGDYNPTGSITFTLVAPNGGTVDSETVTVNGNGTYATPTGYTLPTTGTVTGTYQWNATYSGDTNNVSVSDNNNPNEQVTVNQGLSSVSTAIDSAATGTPVGGDQLLGTAVYDTATVIGSPIAPTPAGTVTYYFYNTASPVYGTTTPVSSETVTLNADGSVPNSAVTAALTAGSYAYVGVYSGDGNYTGYVGAVEPLTVSQGSSSVGTAIDNAATGAPISGNQPLGTSVYDAATVTGSPFAPTGTVTYYFYNTASPVYGTTTPVSTQTATLGADGSVPNSLATAVLTAGSYAYVGVYSGDGNYAGSVGAVEPLTVSQGSSGISTVIDNAATGAAISGNQALGTAVYDAATVAGGAFTPTGTVTYYFYDTASPVYGTTTPVSTQTVTLGADGSVANSAATAALVAGSYAYIAVYSGDGNYAGAVGAPEPVTVNRASPAITTQQQPASAMVGTVIADQATVSGGYSPGGTVTFALYDNPNETGTPLFTDTEPLVGGTATSAGYTTAAVGTDYWVATYNGDGNNNPVSSGTLVLAYPQLSLDSTGQINYTPGTEAFDLTATPLSFTISATSSPLRITDGRSLAVHIHVDNAGNLVAMPGDGLTVTGAVTVNGTPYTGTLLTGSIVAFGFTNDTSGDIPPNTDTDTYYFSFQATGGSMAALFGNQNIGMLASSEHSTFAGSFQTPFTGGAKGTIGPLVAGTAAEPVTVSPAHPGIATIPNLTNVALGTASATLTDTAVLSGGYAPSGTITFTLYDGSTLVDTETAAVHGNGSYTTPSGYALPTTGIVTGAYHWNATYSGNVNNVSVTDNDNPNEQVTVNPGSSNASTTIDNAATGAVIGGDQPLGTAVYDTAIVTGSPNAPLPTGTVTYYFYNTASPVYGTTAPVSAQTVTVSSGAVPNSAATAALAVGGYAYIAVYSGDGNYAGSVGAVEPLAVAKGSSSAGTAIDNAATGAAISGNQPLGTAVYDTASVTGAPFTPTGTVTYYFYNTASPVYGTTAPVSTQTVTVSSGAVPNSAATAALVAGSYAYIAVYSGDGNYTGSVGVVEPLAVAKGSSSVGTAIDNAASGAAISGNQPLGTAVYDTASVTGAPFAPTGTVTYCFYNTASPVYGTTTPVSTQTVTVSSGAVPNSAATAALTVGGYAYIAVYSGDGNYASAVGAVEPLTITYPGGVPPKGTVSTVIDNAATGKSICNSQALGTSVYDTATVTGIQYASTPTGTVTYYFYNTASPVYGTTTPVSTQTVTLSNGVVSNSVATAALAAGSYAYIAVYNGDSTYTGAVGAVEPLTISQGLPSVSTVIDNAATGKSICGSQAAGTSVYDTATVTGTPFTPTGTLTYYFYSTASPVYGTTTPASTQTVTLSNGVVPNSAATAALAAGSYAYIAVYSGDGNYTSCVGAIEPLTINKCTTITISGTKFNDVTGNGFSSDDTALGGVTINLYKESNCNSGLQTGCGSDTLVATTTTTASNGTYSFSGLAAATYYVQEVVPCGYVQTGGGPNGSAGSTYYTLSAQSGQTYTGNNFDDYLMPTYSPTNVSYVVNGCTTVCDIGGQTAQGKTVTVTFTVSTTEQLTLVSYIAPSSSWNQSTAYQQQIFDQASGTFTPGTYSLTVLIPNCYYQVDFFCGPAIDVLVPQTYNGSAYGPDNANITYHAEGRYIDSDNGGTTAFSTKSVASGDFATAGFWSTTTGQNVIKSLNGGSSATSLAKWLATTFPNLYGSGAGSHSLVNSNGTYFTNSQMVSAYAKFTGSDQQVLSAALSVYATSTSLAGTNVHNTDSHFNTSLAGSGMDTYNVGVNGAAFGLANSTTLTVMQLLMDLNASTSAGAAVASGANTVFSSINTIGNVTNADLADMGLAYTPAQIRSAYGIDNLSLDGTGQTIAIVEAYDDPAIAQAVDTYDNQFGLTSSGPTLYQQYGPASSFLTVLNQDGQTTSLPAADPSGPGTANWELEAALDVEWVHAMAPGAQIILVEANSQSLSDLMAGVVTAANQPGVSVVSMSWGFAEGQAVFAQDEALYDGDFTTPAGHQGVTFVASTGDYGTADPEYPAFSPNVLAVGGTSLKLNADDSYENETGWGYFSSSVGTLIGSGGGTSLYEAEPAYQLGVQSTGSRSTPDVSFFADPATGAWISDPYNLSADNSFEVVGGTSLSAPCWAGLIGLANQGRAAAGQPTLNSTTPTDAQQALYSLPQSDFNAITSGSNGGYSAGAGYNMVTGLGTPQANLVVPGLVAYQQASDSYQWVAPTATGEAAPVSVINVFNALTVTGEAPTMSRTSGPASPSGAVGGANALPPISQVWTSLANDALDTKVASTSDIAHLSGFGNVSPNRAAFVLDQLFAASLSPATVTSRASLESRLVAPVGSDQLFGRLGEGLDGQNAMPGFTRDGAAAANDSALQAAMEEWSAGILSDALNLLATSNSPGYHGSAGDVNGSGQQSPGEQALLDLDGILAAQVNDHDIDL